MRRVTAIALTLLFLSTVLSVQAQDAAPRPAASEGEQVTLGHSSIRLYGPWKFHTGDSPMVSGTHTPLWASPDFDDSQWESVDLTPATGSFDPIAGISNYVPGWTARGHAGYTGYAWYRLRVHLASPAGVKLALEGPSDVDDSYQVFANGSLIGTFGDFSAKRDPVGYNTRPLVFSMPQPDGTELIAFRMFMEPGTPLIQPDAGGLHTAPLLGEASVIQAHYQLDWIQGIRAYFTAPLLAALSLLLVVITLALYGLDRGDSVYLWLALVVFLAAVRSTALALTAWTMLVSSALYTVISTITLPLTLGGWVMLWWVWFRLRKPAWMPALIGALTVVYIASSMIGKDVFLPAIPHSVAVRFDTVTVVLRLAMLAALIFVVFRGIREEGRDAWLALPAVLLMCVAQFQMELGVLHIIRPVWFPFGLQLTLSTIAYIFLLGAMLLLLLRRLTLSLRNQRAMAADMKHAQEVQHVLLPESVNVPGYEIVTEYRPAREVGGDFFQILPQLTDGSVLVVTGDVVGKGLQAGMLVALLVGAIRSTAELNSDPQFVLDALNRRLLGRGDARATCLALRIEPNGSVRLANAGHLPPYLNGVEVPMEGALPLGTSAAAEFPVSHFHLGEHDVLTLISDGVVEAQDKNRNMFGFERVRELLRNKTSPAALASAAQHFGQEDDISVLSIRRVAEREPARSPMMDSAAGATSSPLHA